VVEAGWIVRVRFTKELGDGIDDATLRDRFLVAVKLLAEIDCTYRVNAFNTEDGCQGVILKT
jgi:hypothetical protein